MAPLPSLWGSPRSAVICSLNLNLLILFDYISFSGYPIARDSKLIRRRGREWRGEGGKGERNFIDICNYYFFLLQFQRVLCRIASFWALAAHLRMPIAWLLGYHLMWQTTLHCSHFADGKIEFLRDRQFAQCHEVNERHRSELKPDIQMPQQTNTSPAQSLLASPGEWIVYNEPPCTWQLFI